MNNHLIHRIHNRINNYQFAFRKRWHFSRVHNVWKTINLRQYKPCRRILLYTDSRGDNLPEHNYYQHYGERLSQLYDVEAYLCPVKWTTILDFLEFYRTLDNKTYDFVILHAGAVDSAPRQQKVLLEQIYTQKREIFDSILNVSKVHSYLNSDLNCEYEGDKTNNMYSLEMAKSHIIPLLRQIPNLIWISSNKIVPGWRGNYWRERPKNVAVIEEYSNFFSSSLDNVINLMKWSISEVKLYTFDNIHPNEAGSNYIFQEILKMVNELSSKSRSMDFYPL
jgi:hypothetical protein